MSKIDTMFIALLEIAGWLLIGSGLDLSFMTALGGLMLTECIVYPLVCLARRKR